MADRYWVGGTDNWNATAGTKWALTSGGTGGEAVPTSSDDVYLDASSGSGTVNISASAVCNNLTCTGFTGTLNFNSTLIVYGNIVLGSGMTTSGSSSLFMSTQAVTRSITCNGKKLPNLYMGDDTGGGSDPGFIVNLNDDLHCIQFTIEQGTFNTNNYDMYIDVAFYISSNTGAITANLGISTITVHGSSYLVFVSSGFGTVTGTPTYIFDGTTYGVKRFAWSNFAINVNAEFSGNGIIYWDSGFGAGTSINNITVNGPHQIQLSNAVSANSISITPSGSQYSSIISTGSTYNLTVGSISLANTVTYGVTVSLNSDQDVVDCIDCGNTSNFRSFRQPNQKTASLINT